MKVYNCYVARYIPKNFSSQELIVRTIHEPINFKNKRTLNFDPNLFRSPPEKDEISVNRRDYCNDNFCKYLGLINEMPRKQRAYWGLASIECDKILKVAGIKYTPIKKNKSHSDIYTGQPEKRGQPNSHNLAIAKSLLAHSNIHKDDYLNDVQWLNESVKPI